MDLPLQPISALNAVKNPYNLRIVAVSCLVDAGVEVCLVVAALGDQAGRVFGSQVDFDEPVILVSARRSGDDFQVWFQPPRSAAGVEPGAPAVWLGAYERQRAARSLDGVLNDE